MLKYILRPKANSQADLHSHSMQTQCSYRAANSIIVNTSLVEMEIMLPS